MWGWKIVWSDRHLLQQDIKSSNFQSKLHFMASNSFPLNITNIHRRSCGARTAFHKVCQRRCETVKTPKRNALNAPRCFEIKILKKGDCLDPCQPLLALAAPPCDSHCPALTRHVRVHLSGAPSRPQQMNRHRGQSCFAPCYEYDDS